MTLSRLPLADCLINWHKKHGRHHLPWQQQRNAYRVWVSEIMLQQTQVATVIPYYQRFITEFPSITHLARACIDQVLTLWTGLGYYARARNLHKTAIIIHQKHHQRFPNSLTELCTLPGIGRSTAGAILSFGFGITASILDGNIKRVLSRLHAIDQDIRQSSTLKLLWQIAEAHTPERHCATYNQAMMDLGANICTRQKPDCPSCPLKHYCKAYQQGNVTTYPMSSPRKPLTHKKIIWIILRNTQQALLLQRRPPVGIWGGLWSFPECCPDQSPLDYCEHQLGYKVVQQQQLDLIQHSFSHFRLHINPIILQPTQAISHVINDHHTQQWYNLKNPLPGGIAAPVKKLLAVL